MNHEALVVHYSEEGAGCGCGVRRVRFCAQLTGESYYSTSWYMCSVLKKVLEYRSPLYRSTGIQFKKLFLSIVFTILKKSYFWNIQPVHLGFFKHFSKISQKPCLRLLTFVWTHVLTCSSCISENMYKNQYSLRSFVLANETCKPCIFKHVLPVC